MSGDENDVQSEAEEMDMEGAAHHMEEEERVDVEESTKPMSKAQRNLDLIYNPEKCDDAGMNRKSLWRFYEERILKFPTVDDLAAARERAGEIVDMETVYLDWYHKVLEAFRDYLQEALEEPLDLASMGKRLATFQQTHKGDVQRWRAEWIERYKTFGGRPIRETQQSSNNTSAQSTNLADRKAAAVLKRKAAAAAKKQAETSAALQEAAVPSK